MPFTLSSSAFSNNGSVPDIYTCDGNDASPPLAWSGVPEGTKSLALIVDDPDAPDPAAPQTRYVHWVIYNLPPTTDHLSEDVHSLPAGAREGLNDWKRVGYGGPCPRIGRHRYVFTLYALDVMLDDLGAPTRMTLEQAMQGHVLAHTELVGTYARINPPRTTTGPLTAPKFGSAGSGGAELESGLRRN